MKLPIMMLVMMMMMMLAYGRDDDYAADTIMLSLIFLATDLFDLRITDEAWSLMFRILLLGTTFFKVCTN